VSRTKRLLIRPLREEHADALFEALDDPRVGTYIGGPVAQSPAALRERIRQQELGPAPGQEVERWWNFLVEVADLVESTGSGVVGTLQATLYDDWAEVAYLFGPAGWGQGYATEGLQWLVGRCEDAGVSELWAAVHPDNVPSQRVLGRVGFVRRDRTPRALGSYDPGDLVFLRPPTR
jgi:RimJ/RimL family protein N-acetyltransferase